MRQLTPQTLKPEDVYRAQSILVQKTNTILTPENVQIHSQGAAFLLVWAANVIKLYAASQWVGGIFKEEPSKYKNMKTSDYGLQDLQQVTLQTKLDMRKNDRQKASNKSPSKAQNLKDIEDALDLEEEMATKEDDENKDMAEEEKARRKANRAQNRKHAMTVNREKVGTIGYFATPKPMVFDRDVSSLVPEGHSKEKKLIDYSVMKKGLKAGSRKTKKADEMYENDLLAVEEGIANDEKEKARQAKIAESQNKNVQEDAD